VLVCRNPLSGLDPPRFAPRASGLSGLRITPFVVAPASTDELRNVLVVAGHIDASFRLTLPKGGVSWLVL
jgi:hypothetical protein